MPFTRSRRSLAVLGLALIAAPLLAAPADVVRTRQAGLRGMGAAFKNVMDGLRSGTPQPRVMQQSARVISSAARAQFGWFPAGTGPNPAWKTAAKPEIWTQTAEFRTAQDGLARAAQGFQSAALGGNAEAIQAAARTLGGACKSCHDQFKAKDKL